MLIRAIFFDFDGVLVDSEPIHYETWSAVLAPKGIRVSFEDYCRRFIGVSNREMIRALCQDHGRPFDLDLFQAWYAEKRALYDLKELVTPPDLVGFIRDGLNGYRLGVVSSSRHSEVDPHLVRSGIRHRLEVVVCADDVPRLKPAPDPYQKASALSGVVPAECLAVEDSEAGQRAALAAGMRVLRVGACAEVSPRLRACLEST